MPETNTGPTKADFIDIMRAKDELERLFTNPEPTKWETTANRFVGFIDIMGFKDWVARSPHDEIYDKMRSIVASLKEYEANVATKARQFFKSTIYSDSIIFYSDSDDLLATGLICSLMNVFSDTLFQLGIPHKGALAYGKMTLDYENSIFFGQPLIDAYLLQEELALYGIVVHSSAEVALQRVSSFHSLVFDYPCPFKAGNARHFTIPPLYCKNYFNATDGQAKFMSGFKGFRHTTSGHIRKYIDNTEAYLKAYNPDLNFDV